MSRSGHARRGFKVMHTMTLITGIRGRGWTASWGGMFWVAEEKKTMIKGKGGWEGGGGGGDWGGV